MDILAFLSHNEYLVLFIGLLFAGEVVLLPAIYLALAGRLDPGIVFFAAVASGVLSDIVWYKLASHAPLTQVKSWKLIARHKNEFARLAALFDAHQYRILFLSKFVYGTRIIVQLICGIRHMPFGPYLLVNAAGAASYILLLFALAIALESVVTPGDVRELQASFIAFVGIVIGIHVWIRYLARKKWFQS
jgi:membrane protein DedA with SNARE-associated domain